MNGTENEKLSLHKSNRLKNKDENKKPKGPQFNTPFIYDDNLDTLSIENVLLIHDEIGNYKSLYDKCNTNTLGIVYSVRSNSDDLNTLLKSKFSKINRLAIAFHDPGFDQYKTFLNYALLFTPDDLKEDIKEYSVNITFMINLIKDFNIVNIDFLGCNTLKYDNWNSYYSLLMKESSVIVGASNDDTGNIKYGGDWIMESTHEDIKSIYFTNGIENYSGLLAASEIRSTGIIYLQQSENDIQWSTNTLSDWQTIGFPCTLINNAWTQSTSILTVKQYSDLIINSASGYFQMGSEYITFDGNGYTITISGLTNYIGLINNGNNSSGSGKSNITLENLIVNSDNNSSTLADGAGWIGQQYFGEGTGTLGGIINTANNCINYGNIYGYNSPYYSGGIFGVYAGNNYGTVIVNNCVNYGNVGDNSNYYGGGIFGGYAGNNYGIVTANNCINHGNIGEFSGGIFGSCAGQNYGTASSNNCYSTGEISGQNSGGIFGDAAGDTYGTVNAKNCYSTGDILGQNSGGIFGDNAGKNNGIVSAENCFSTGEISGQYSGGIFGISAGYNGTANAKKCYSTGNITGYYSGGISGYWFGYNSNNLCQIVNCYSVGNILG
jgi:hypothetical protein